MAQIVDYFTVLGLAEVIALALQFEPYRMQLLSKD